MTAAFPKRGTDLYHDVRARRLRPFPLWEVQHPEEPAYGLLARTVERNLPGTFTARLHDLGAHGGHSVTRADVAGIARVCNAEASALRRSTPRVGRTHATVLGQRFRRDDFSVARRRWCPTCLADHGCHLAWWDLTIVSSCPRHSAALVDRCSCGTAVPWKGQSLFGSCECGRRLADMPAAGLGPDEGAADRYVVGRLTDVGRWRVPFLDRLPLPDAVEVLRNVGHLAIRPQAGRRPLEREVGFRRLLDAGFAGVNEFPASFQRILDRTLENAVVPPGKFGASRVYGSTFVTWVVKREPKSARGTISAELRSHAERNLTLNKSKLFGAKIDRKRVGIAEASEICGTSFSRTKRILTERGLLSAGHGSRSASVRREEVERIASILREGVSLQDVARELDVLPKFVRSMIQAGHVKPLILRGDAASWLLPLDSANVLMGRLLESVQQDAEGGESLPVHLAAWSLGIGMADVVCEVLDGSIRAVGVVPEVAGVRSILVDVSARRASLRRVPTGILTARDLARTFALKEEDAAEMLRAGVVRAERTGHAWRIERAVAEEFFRVNVCLGPYAAKLGTSRRHLALRLETAGIKPSFGPPILRRKLFRRDEIDAFLEREGRLPRD